MPCGSPSLWMLAPIAACALPWVTDSSKWGYELGSCFEGQSGSWKGCEGDLGASGRRSAKRRRKAQGWTQQVGEPLLSLQPEVAGAGSGLGPVGGAKRQECGRWTGFSVEINLLVRTFHTKG